MQGPTPRGRALRSGRAGAIGVLLTERLSYAFGDPAAVATLRGLAAGGRARRHLALPAPRAAHGGDAESVTHARSSTRCFVYALPEHHPSVAAALERHLPMVICRHAARARRPARLDRRPRRSARRGAAPARPRPPPHRGRHPARARGRPPRLDRRRPPPRRPLPRHHRAARGLQGRDRRRRPRLGRGADLRGPNARALGAEAAPALLALEPRPTAVLGMSDEIALGVIDGVRAAGLSIPEDVSVVGFDDAPRRARGATSPRSASRWSRRAAPPAACCSRRSPARRRPTSSCRPSSSSGMRPPSTAKAVTTAPPRRGSPRAGHLAGGRVAARPPGRRRRTR